MPVEQPHEDFIFWQSVYRKCRDFAGGQPFVKAMGETYLPRISGRRDRKANEAYELYLRYASLYNATGQTLRGYLGMVFRKPGIMEYPKALQPIVDNITGGRVNLQKFAKRFMRERLTCRRAGILVDYPVAISDQRIVTAPQAQALGLRTYWSLYRAESIINWDFVQVGAEKVLSLVVLRESAWERIDRFSKRRVPAYRVLGLDEAGYYFVQVWTRANGVSEFAPGPAIYPLNNGERLRFIPFSCSDLFEEPEAPVIADLVDQNEAWYRHNANLEWGALWTANPQVVITGHDAKEDKEWAWGSRKALVLKEPQARANIVELQQEFGAIFAMLDRDEQRMAILGARMLMPEKRAALAAETAVMQSRGESSILASEADEASADLEQALRWTVEWEGLAGEAKLRLNTNFFPAPMSPQGIAALVAAWQGKAFARLDLTRALKKGEVIEEDREIDDILADLEGEADTPGMDDLTAQEGEEFNTNDPAAGDPNKEEKPEKPKRKPAPRKKSAEAA